MTSSNGPLIAEISAQADKLEQQAHDLIGAAEQSGARPPFQEIERLMRSADTLDYQASILREADRIRDSRGTAEELVSMMPLLTMRTRSGPPSPMGWVKAEVSGKTSSMWWPTCTRCGEIIPPGQEDGKLSRHAFCSPWG
ncbi:MAG: hypothetical protein ACRDFS_10690 [Chloroflexota bacterium]